jgi:CheY-like chemotaxis protein
VGRDKVDNAQFKGIVRHVLVAEDSAIIALDLEMVLTGLGIAQVTIASTAAQAVVALDGGGVDAAFIDVFLGTDDGRIVAERLIALAIPFALVTSLDEADRLLAQFPGVPVLSKPFAGPDVAEVLARLC